MKQPTPEEVIARMVSLHKELTNFTYYLAMNSGRMPPTPDEEDSKAITHIQVRLETEVARMQKAGGQRRHFGPPERTKKRDKVAKRELVAGEA